MFIEVAVAVPSEKTFTYAVPEELKEEIAVGKRVLVPFGKKRVTGYIVDIVSTADRTDIREVLDVLDEEPLFDERDLRFYRWAADYYMYPLGKTLGEILPAGINVESGSWAFLDKDDGESVPKSGIQRKLLDVLRDHPEGMSIRNLKKVMKSDGIRRDLRRLCEAGLIRLEERIARPEVRPRKERFVVVSPDRDLETRLSKKESGVIRYLLEQGETPFSNLKRDFNATADFIRRLEEKGAVRTMERETFRTASEGPAIGRTGEVRLNEAQEGALREVLGGLASGKFSPYLLHGVTGSGKTEVYLRALEETLRLGGSAVFLVPEIALTPQLLSRIRDRFRGNEIAVVHSDVSRTVRYDQWRRISRGEIRIIAGARSAIFAPVRDLKLVIVDEEHDGSYKQDERMRYNARDLAIVKAKMSGAAIVLGSATPGLRTYFNAKNRRYRYLSLPDRAGERSHPKVEILDMRREKEERERAGLLSRSLRSAIGETLDAGKQTLLLLNRRGFHTFLFCADCGHVLRCLNCSVSMTHHAGEGILKCHYCDFAVKAAPLCPACRGSRVKSHGAGTERLEEEIVRTFPGARTGRMDSDTTARRGVREKILQAFDRGELDILIGTQMIAKGHDNPNVLLVGVVMADASLNIPDFRAAENTFQLLTQVAGRGGRGDEPGRVIIQTYTPEHYAVRHAERQDYPSFYREEIALRKAAGYPPYSRMVNIHISGPKEDKIGEGAKGIAEIAKALAGSVRDKVRVTVIGPAEAPIPKLKGRYRWQLILKGEDVRALHAVARGVLAQCGGMGLDLRVDVDPLNFM